MKAEYSKAKKAGKLNILYDIIFALILGGACFYVFISMFGLKYDAGSMFSGSFSGGLAGIWNAAADKLGTLDYVILPKYRPELDPDGNALYGFALTMILAALSLVSFLIVRSKIRLLLLLYAVPLAMLVLIFMLTPSFMAGTLFAAAVIAVLALMNLKGRITPVYFILPLIAVMIGMGAVLAVENTVGLKEPKALANYGASVRASASQKVYGTDPLPAGDVGNLSGKELKAARGDINEVKAALGKGAAERAEAEDADNSDIGKAEADEEESKGKGTALTVTMSEPDSYYLRGFIGAEYDKNKWETLPNDVFYDMRDKLFWMNRRGFDGLSELAQASKLGQAASKEIDIKVSVKDASRKTAYIPYELTLKQAQGDKARTSELVLPEGTKNYGGSHLGTEGLTGKREYSYKASENLTGIWTDAVGKFYTTKADEEINRFFVSESHYNVMQYEQYLNIPARLLPLFKREIGTPGDISKNHADYKDTIDVISKYLKDRYIYSETFGQIKGKTSGKTDSSDWKNASVNMSKDFVEEFINAKRGSDVHFATLATLMFRYFGIPARYVEGYLITPANVSGAAGKTRVDVSRSANHAWTEIYIDGFGWIPVEATPEYSGIMKEADLTKGLQNVDYETMQNERTNVEEEEPVEEENDEQDDLKEFLLNILKVIAIIIGSLLLLALLVFVLIKLIAFIKWRRAFADKDPKAGIRALYQYTAVNKWKLAEAGEDLGLRASYSLDEMAEPDRTKMRAEVKKAKERAKAEASKKRGKKNEKAK